MPSPTANSDPSAGMFPCQSFSAPALGATRDRFLPHIPASPGILFQVGHLFRTMPVSLPSPLLSLLAGALLSWLLPACSRPSHRDDATPPQPLAASCGDSEVGPAATCPSCSVQCVGTRLYWVDIPGGSFQMGSALEWNEEREHEYPRHVVNLESFQMLRSEVTVAQYRQCVLAGACSPHPDPANKGRLCNYGRPQHDERPMNCVDWAMADSFCQWIGAHLPSESQWEYAATSLGKDRSYPWGEQEPSCELAVVNDPGHYYCGGDPTLDVCSKPAGNTQQGLCDMAGNVHEWVWDWYHPTYDGAPTDGSANLERVAGHRIMRGGGVGSKAAYRNTNRVHHPGSFYYPGLGFRCAR